MIYRPPNSSLARFFEQLDIILDKCDLNQNFLIVGDFNIDCNNKSFTDKTTFKNIKFTLDMEIKKAKLIIF